MDGVSTTDTTKFCNSFCNYFNAQLKNIHESIPVSNSHNLDQIDINDRSRYFRQATETEIVEFVMQLNKEGGNNYVSRKFFIMCKNRVTFYLKQIFIFCICPCLFPNIFKFAQNTPIHKKRFTSQYSKLLTGFCPK